MSDIEGSFAAVGSGKSEAEVAFDLLNKLKGQGVWGERNLGAILDMFAECLDAAKGYRAYPGQNKVNVGIKQIGPASATQQTTAPQAATTPAPAQAQLQTAAPAAPQQQAAPVQPVHAQQQSLQQAYKPAV